MINWYYKEQGGHTHVRVFVEGAKCGELCFRNEEFAAIRAGLGELNSMFELIPEGDALIFGSPDKPAIVCRTCGLTSYHPEDVANHYCGHCHKYHETVTIAQ